MLKKFFLLITLSCFLAQTALAGQIRIPANTRIYVETQEYVIGKKKRFPEGSTVRASVWRDVIIDGVTVIEAGTPVLVRVDRLKGPKVAGIKGKMELGAYETTLANGQPIQLGGGYFKKGKGRIALSATLAGVVFLPLIFIPGKKAKLPAGTVFDAFTDHTTTVEIDTQQSRPKINLSGYTNKAFSVDVLYDELSEQKKPKFFPLQISNFSDPNPSFQVRTVNGVAIKPVDIEQVSQIGSEGRFKGALEINKISKHFKQGINRFEVYADLDGETVSTEVVLDLQF